MPPDPIFGEARIVKRAQSGIARTQVELGAEVSASFEGVQIPFGAGIRFQEFLPIRGIRNARNDVAVGKIWIGVEIRYVVLEGDAELSQITLANRVVGVSLGATQR